VGEAIAETRRSCPHQDGLRESTINEMLGYALWQSYDSTGARAS
jgi:hypothetical protein